MSDQAYVVVGSTGRYSDHQYWFVAAFHDHAAAAEYAKRANEWLLARYPDGNDAAYRDDDYGSPWDPQLRVDLDTEYTVESLPLLATPIPIRGQNGGSSRGCKQPDPLGGTGPGDKQPTSDPVEPGGSGRQPTEEG